jgi:hypothetical protein
MAKVIEFYVPKNFRNTFVRAARPQPGKLIEFPSQANSKAKKSVPTRPAGGVLAWLLEETDEPNRGVGREWSSDPGVA